ncbi:MAG: DMT family transporter [Thomasclavelia sp.]|nr:DMT family transporter [Thomasclavelia sp.]
MDKKKIKAILYAVLAAVFYAINMPFSKLLLKIIQPTMMAAFLYLGAGIGIGIIFFLNKKSDNKSDYLSKNDLPYVLGMIGLDIIAPILLMFGLLNTSSANASLLNNFEIVATSVIALVVFKEIISRRLWIGIFLITISSIILSFKDITSFNFSSGSLLVILATICWGFENNCTRKISSKNTYQIVMLKGIFSGLGSLIIALIIGEQIPDIKYWLVILLLGFVAYGLSILFYIMAQSELGAAKTSAYYAISPFIGVLLSFVLLKEQITSNYLLALIIMIIGSIIVVIDTLIINHEHMHIHTYVHTHNGTPNSHTIAHSHVHSHLSSDEDHKHHHNKAKI